jgi:hypothetical protein
MVPLVGVVKPVLQGFQRWAGGDAAVANQADALIGQRIAQDTAAGGPAIPDMQNKLNLTPNKPLGLVNVGGENLQALAGNVARAPGPSRQGAANFFNDQDVDAGTRLIGDIDQGLKTGGNAFDAVQQLMQQRAQAAAPLYQQAFANGQNIASPRIQQFIADPLLQKGLAQGLQVQRLEALASGQPFNPADYTITTDAAGNPTFAAGANNLRTLDAAKRGLDTLVDQSRNRLRSRSTSKAVPSRRCVARS